MRHSKFPAGDQTFKAACLSQINLNEESSAKLSAWVNNPHDFLLYLGTPGCGKTFFCAAMTNFLKEKHIPFIFNFERDFFANLRGIIEQSWDPKIELDKICEVPFVILDDMGSTRADKLTDWQKDMLFHFVDERCLSRLPTIITSNHFLRDIKENFGDRFYSRMAAKRNTIIELQDQDLRQVYD